MDKWDKEQLISPPSTGQDPKSYDCLLMKRVQENTLQICGGNEKWFRMD